jgi:hypothetical protein
MGRQGFEVGFDKFRRDFRHDCIAVSPQKSHATGYPMSQRECPGLNAPRFSVAEGEDVEIAPRT